MTALLLAAAGVTMADSLLLKEQGSFFVGGHTIFTDALTGSTTGFLGTGINTRKHHGRPDVRPVSDSRRRRFACSRRHGARMLPQLEELRDHSRRAHGLERIFSAGNTAPSIFPTRFRARVPDSTRPSTTKLNWESARRPTCPRCAQRPTKLPGWASASARSVGKAFARRTVPGGGI